jgi:hypothetical protein
MQLIAMCKLTRRNCFIQKYRVFSDEFSKSRLPIPKPSPIRRSSCFVAQLAELVDALVLGTSAKSVGVRVPHWAPKQDFRVKPDYKEPRLTRGFLLLSA